MIRDVRPSARVAGERLALAGAAGFTVEEFAAGVRRGVELTSISMKDLRDGQREESKR